MGSAEDRRQVVVRWVADDQTISNVTDRTELRVDDQGVVRVEDGGIVASGVGETQLHASFQGASAKAIVHVIDNAAAGIVDFWLSAMEPLRLHQVGADVDLAASAILSNGARVAVDERLEWSSSAPSAFSVDASGRVVAIGEGAGAVRVRDPGSGRERSLEVAVALPRPSGSTLLLHQGGLIVNGDLSLYVPPFALDADRPVAIQPWVAPNTLPPGHEPVAAFQVLIGGTLRKPVELCVATSMDGDDRRGIAQVWSQPPGSSSLQAQFRVYWEAAGQSWFQLPEPARYALSFDPSLAEDLAWQYAPVLSLATDDVHPIAFDQLLSECQLRTSTGVVTSPTAADLLTEANNRTDSRLELRTVARDDFLQTDTWRNARLGGTEVANPLPPVVYWALRGAKRFLVLQYWFLYAASGQPYYGGENGYHLAHEGDLEMVQVLLESSGTNFAPVAATASQHYYGEGRHWRDVTREGDRLLVHVAEAGHATYFERGFGGVGDEHRSYSGEEGFVGKIEPFWYAADRCAGDSRRRLLEPGQYELRDLHAATDESRALLRFQGRIGRDADVWSLWAEATSSVVTRGPTTDFSIYDRPEQFHRSFLFSTATAIAAVKRNGTGRSERLRQGMQMAKLQVHTAGRWEGAVQSRIDTACATEVGQPLHLARHLDSTTRPEDYYACEDWRLVSIEPETPAEVVVDQPVTVRITWRGTRRDGHALRFPLHVTLLMATDLGWVGFMPITWWEGSVAMAGAIWLFGAGAMPDETQTTVELPLTWTTSVSGGSGLPPGACATLSPTSFPAAFHLWITDDAGKQLHLTCSTPGCQQIMPATGEPLRFVVRVCP